jgi:hypothetical protein
MGKSAESVTICVTGSPPTRTVVPFGRPHHSDPSKHRRTVMLGNQQQRFHRGLPFFGVVFYGTAALA